MGTAKYLRPVLLLTGILSLLQSIAWFIMSLLGVLAYRCEMPVPDPKEDKISSLMYFLYFQGHDCSISQEDIVENAANDIPFGLAIKNSLYANPNMINSWMASYLAFNITYMFLSIAILVGYCRMKENYPPYTTIRLWCLNTLVFLVLDFWLTIIWGIDFKNIQNVVSKYHLDSTLGWASSVPGALMAITARGFILYVINLILFIYLVKNSVPWSDLFLCCSRSKYGSSSQGQRRQQQAPYRIPRVSTTVEPWDNGQALVPYRAPARGYTNEAMPQTTYFNEGSRYPPQQTRYDSGRRRSFDNVVHTSAVHDRGYDAPIDPRQYGDRDEDFDILPHSSRQEPSFPARGKPTARSVFDNKDRKNFEQGHGPSPSKTYGLPLKVPPGARNNDFY